MSRARDNANLSPTIPDARMPNLTGDVTTVEGAVDTTIATGAVDIAMLSATGTASSTTFLCGDNSWTTVTTDLVGDTTPQLGGNLDVNEKSIVSISNKDIAITPHGTGKVVIASDVNFTSTASIKVPTGTTAQQGTATTGAFRFNTTDTGFEGYDGSAWASLGGVAGITDNSTSVAITIDSSENVGIGTTTPGAYKLYVNGDIYCDDISTSDIKMCNDRPNHPGNEIDGTKGSWTFQEGSENMYLINRKSGKRYKLKLEEV